MLRKDGLAGIRCCTCQTLHIKPYASKLSLCGHIFHLEPKTKEGKFLIIHTLKKYCHPASIPYADEKWLMLSVWLRVQSIICIILWQRFRSTPQNLPLLPSLDKVTLKYSSPEKPLQEFFTFDWLFQRTSTFLTSRNPNEQYKNSWWWLNLRILYHNKQYIFVHEPDAIKLVIENQICIWKNELWPIVMT